MSVRKAGLKCVSDTKELNSVLHTVSTALPGALSRLMSRISVTVALQKFLVVSTKNAYCLSKCEIFPMIVGCCSFFRIVVAFAWCSSRLKGFLVCVFWCLVPFTSERAFLIKCLHLMNSKHKAACLVLLRVKACLSSSGAHL